MTTQRDVDQLRYEEHGSTFDKIVRTARVEHRCCNAAMAERGVNTLVANCHRTIKAGEHYIQGEIDPYRAGGFGHEYVCMDCADRGNA